MEGRILWTLGMSALLLSVSFAATPSTAKKGVGFQTVCHADWPKKGCKPLRIPSPNGKNRIEVRYSKDKQSGSMSAYLEVFKAEQDLGSADPREWDPGSDSDVLWSPDSTKFFVNRGGESAIGMFWVDVYSLDDPKLEPINTATNALRDMVITFPPCRARDWDPYMDCEELTRDPGFINMSGVDWLPDSSAIVVMAEVLPSSRFGGIMGEVMGYVIEVPSGKILQRMSGHDFAKRWRHSFAFKFQDPGPPEYKDDQPHN
jgi:hypothetical protein